MADSVAHRFGQIIGDLLEDTIIRYCMPIADEYEMYLDYKHSRQARHNNKEVKWKDINENTHKLDIVIEREGSETEYGTPEAFIEVAWRRYTKHSKNKVQEISAAIKPLVQLYSEACPFYGAVLAGEFTNNSLNQMRSEGFKLLHFSNEAIEEAFASQGIDAHWEESTSEKELQERIDQFNKLSKEQIKAIGDILMKNNIAKWESFLQCLRNALERKIKIIYITSLFGISKVFSNVQDACNYVAFDEEEISFNQNTFHGYEIVVEYSNGDKINMQFKEKQMALASLNRLR